MDKKYQVFVSSTFRDLVEERQETIRTILDLGHIPAGMEMFPATDTEQLSYIRKVIDECDYYLLIIGGRYGSFDEAGVGFTEREYDYAVEADKVVIAFIHGDPGSIPVSKSDISPIVAELLNAFRAKVSTGRLVKFWTSKDNLVVEVTKSLVKTMADLPQPGWIRGGAVASEELVSQVNSLLIENRDLKERLSKLDLDLKPKIENIADFDDIFEMRYKYSEPGYASKHSAKINLSWREIFKAVAPVLVKPSTPTVLNGAISNYVRENRNISRYPDFYATDLTTINVQLVALGLINSYVSKTTQGGVAEFLVLTERGKSMFAETLVVKKTES